MWIVQWLVFGIFLIITACILAILPLAWRQPPGKWPVPEPGEGHPDGSRRRFDGPLRLTWTAALVWMVVFGISFARSIRGTGGDNSQFADGPVYATSGNPLEPAMFILSGAAALTILIAVLWAKQKRPAPRWAWGTLLAAVWVLMSNFLAYCFGCVVYETLLKR